MKPTIPSLDSFDRKLLDSLQTAIPISARPFADVGADCGLNEENVIARLQKLKETKVLRQISAIFDTRSLGYASSLVAAKIDSEILDHAVEVISSHPGVSHNYLRNHDFNLWYTIAVSPMSSLGLNETVDLLHQQSGAKATRLLPTLKLFKIGVRFDLGNESQAGKKESKGYSEAHRRNGEPLTADEIEFVRAMQQDLPLLPNPFGQIADTLAFTLGELREMHDAFLANGRMRRFAAVLHHRKAGFSANAMGVWAAPGDDDELHRLGSAMAAFRAVSHCYRRPSYHDWPYNLFTMVHGKSEEECEQSLDAIASATGLTDRMALYSTREFKKVRVRYFTDEEAEWEKAQINLVETKPAR